MKRAVGVWSSAMIRHILANETYIGVWHFGRTRMENDGKSATRKTKSKRGLGKQVARSHDEWIAVTVPAIIDRKMWDAAHARLRNNKREEPVF